MHSCYFKYIIYCILFSFLNMTFAPVVEAMLGDAETEGGALRQRRVSSSASVPPDDGVVFVPVPRSKSQGPVPSVDTSPIHTLARTFQQVQFPADPDFWVSLSGFNEALRRREELNIHAQRAITALSGTGAGLVGAAITELLMFDGPVESLLGLPLGIPVPPIPLNLAVAGAVGGFLVVPDVYWTLKKGLHDYCRRSSQYDPLAREEDRGKSMGFAFVLGGIALFSGKEVFAFITANIGAPIWLIPIIVVAGAPYIVLKIKSAYDIFLEGWDYIYRGGKHWILNKMSHRIAGEEAKDEIRTAFGKAFRKNLHDPEAGMDLFISVQAVHSFVEEQTQGFLRTLETLKKRHALRTTSKVDKEQIDLQIVKIEDDLLNIQRLGDLLIFKLLHDFGQNKSAASSKGGDSPDKDPDASPRKRHPWWDYTAKSTGVIVGGMASGSVWYGFKFILDTFGAPDAVSRGLASVLAPPMVAYLMKKWGDSFARIFRFATDYNPIEAEKHITQPAVSYPRFRAVMEFLNLCRSTYVNLPTSLVGGEGMYVAQIPLDQGLWTLAPSMMGYGAALNEETSRRLADMISSAHMQFGKGNWKENIKQWVAGELFRASEWVDRLKGRNAILLREYMRKDPQNWFASAIPAAVVLPPRVRVVDVTGVGDDEVASPAPTDAVVDGGVASDGSGGSPIRPGSDMQPDGALGEAAPLLASDGASGAQVVPPVLVDSLDATRSSPGGDGPASLPQSPRPSLPPAGADVPLREFDLAQRMGSSSAFRPAQSTPPLPSHGPKRWAMQALEYLKRKSLSLVEEVAVQISPFTSDYPRPPATRVMGGDHLRPDRQQSVRVSQSDVDQLMRPLLSGQQR